MGNRSSKVLPKTLVQSFAKIHGELISLRLKKETEMFRFKELKCATALFIFSGMCFAVQM